VRYSGRDILFAASKDYYDGALYPAAASFDGASVDGLSPTLDAPKYAVAHGSTKLTLLAAYLDTLAAGAHTLTLHYGDGVKITGAFNVLEAPPALYTLTVSAGAGGSVTGTAPGSYAAGAAVSLAAAPDAGYAFTGWTVAGAAADASANPLAFAMPAGDVTVTANFEPGGGYTLTVNAQAGGKVTGTPPGAYAPGIGVTLLAAPDAGYAFAGWTVAGTAADASANPLAFAMPAGDVTVTARFEAAGGGAGSNPGNAGGGSAGTGDGAHPLLWVLLCLAALCGALIFPEICKKTLCNTFQNL
jgi:uncharacterized repeat protein (TIGR02543 family)